MNEVHFSLPSRIHRPWLYTLGDAIDALEAADSPLDRALSEFLRSRRRLGSRDRRFIRDAVYGWARARLRFDERLSSRDAKLPPHERAAALLHIELGAPISMLPLSEEGLSRVRSVAAHSLPTPSAPLAAIARETALPVWLIAEWTDAFGQSAQAIANAMKQRAPFQLRVNTRRTSREELIDRLGREGIAVQPTALSPAGLVANHRIDVRKLAAFQEGLFEVQDEGSQLLALASAEPDARLILDYCAGAGGKTLALANACSATARIIAHDSDGRRLERLKPRLERAHTPNIAINEAARREGLTALNARCDVVLVDAPCTGIGTLRRNPDKAWTVTPGHVEDMHRRQSAILRQAAEYVRPGGVLVYGTCSLVRRENDAVVRSFLDEHAFEADSVSGALVRHGISVDDSRSDLTLRPDEHGTDGFYVARMRRMIAERS